MGDFINAAEFPQFTSRASAAGEAAASRVSSMVRTSKGRKPPKIITRVDFDPFTKMVKKMQKKMGKNADEINDVIKMQTALVLSRTANKLGVAAKKGSFTTSISKGKSRMKNRYTWKRPPVSGRYAGKIPNNHADVAVSIKINGRRFALRAYQKYVSNGSVTMVQSAITKIRESAIKSVASSKAAFYQIAKELKLKTGGFKDAGQLRIALQEVGPSYNKANHGKVIGRATEYTLEIKSSAANALNPNVRGKAEFQRAINGIANEYTKAVKKGAIKCYSRLAAYYGAQLKDG